MDCCKKNCRKEAEWLIGTAKVPYCTAHAAIYPTHVGQGRHRVEIPRERVEGEPPAAEQSGQEKT